MKKLIIASLMAFYMLLGRASDLVDFVTMTPNVVALHFVDGTVQYHGYHQAESDDVLVNSPLPVARASHFLAYKVYSSDDARYATGMHPVKVGRKSKPAFFNRNCKWTGTMCDNDYVLEHWIYVELPQPLVEGSDYSFWVGDLADNLDVLEFEYTPSIIRSELIHVNQHGYTPGSGAKFAYLAHWAGDFGPLDLDFLQGTPFHLVSMLDESIAYSGTVSTKRRDLDSGDQDFGDPESWGGTNNVYGSDVWEIDFSDFTIPGEYRLVVEGVGSSYPFSIDENAYREAYYYTTRGLYMQRAGIAKEAEYAGKWAQPRDHHPDDGLTKLYYTSYPSVLTGEGSTSKDSILNNVVGEIRDWGWGWYHDAGDWDGYVHHTDVPFFLLAAYELAPQNFRDNELNIPESGNGIPDILDEAAWLINYFRRNQQPDGGIAGGRVNSDFNEKPDTSPSYEDARPWYVGGADPQTSYLFAGLVTQYAYCLEMAGITDLTATLLAEAKAAYAWAGDHHDLAPDATVKGASLGDLRMFAAAGIFKLGGDLEYQEDFIEENRLTSEASSLSGGGYNQSKAVWTYVMAPDHAGSDLALKSMLKEAVINYAINDFLEPARMRSGRMGYAWNKPAVVGSTTTPINIAPMFAYALTDGALKEELMDYMQSTADYFLGNNPLNMSWITGLGDRSPRRMLHLDSRFDIGMLDPIVPGLVPYGPLRNGDHFLGTDAQGPWDADFAKIRSYPDRYEWPVSEFWFDNPYSVLDGEFTVHQTNAPAASSYGFLAADTNQYFMVNEAPEISFLAPLAQQTVNESDSLKAEVQVSDDVGVFYVMYFLDHHPVYINIYPPYELSWPVRDLPEGTYRIRAMAVDLDGRESWVEGPEVTIQHDFRPQVAISPDSDTLVEGQVLDVAVDLSGISGGTVSEVRLELNGMLVGELSAAPYTFSIDSIFPLFNEIKAVVVFEEGFESSAKISKYAKPGVSGVNLLNETVEVHAGESVSLEYQVIPPEAENNAVTFQSLNESVVTVSETGLARGEAEGSGQVVITTMEGGFTDTVLVKVLAPRPGGPYGGRPVYLPGVIEAEHFDFGGEGFAYHDNTIGNSEEVYRFEDVDVGQSFDDGATAYQVTGVAAGEWLNYTVDAPEDGLYNFRFRYTAGSVDPSITIKSDGEEIITLSLPQVGWWPLEDGSVEDIPLAAGEQVITLQFNNGPLTLNYVEVLCPECTSVPPREVSLNYKDIELPVGGSIQLVAGIEPVTTTNKTVFWSSTGEGIVSVDQEGVVTALKAGTAMVIAETEARALRDTCLVTVMEGSAYMPGLDYAYYEGEWDLMPGFDTMSPVLTGRIANFDLSPALQEDNFGFSFTGGIKIFETGDYTFYTTSDDGSLLFIDDVLIVDNDGLHASVEQGGIVTLDSGLHDIEVRYFEQGGGEVLEVSYDGPGLDKQAIPDSVLTTYIEGSEVVALQGIALPVNVSVPLGKSRLLPVEFIPENASDRQLEFSSGNALVVQVNNYGWVAGLQEGSANVQATSRDGGHTTSTTVRVINDAPAVAITSPADGSEFMDTAHIEVHVTGRDTIGGIAGYELFLDGELIGGAEGDDGNFLIGPLAEGNYILTARATDVHGKMGGSVEVGIRITSLVSVDEQLALVSGLKVQPNPFDEQVHFTLTLAKALQVRLEIYDLAGSLVYQHTPMDLKEGSHRITWDGKGPGGQGLPTGGYMARFILDAEDGLEMAHELLIKK